MDLIIGCGYVGELVARLLHEAGNKVVGVTHSAASADALASRSLYPVRDGDVSNFSAVDAMAKSLGGSVKTILHCASSGRGGAESYQRVYVEGCRNLISAFPEARIVFTSSSSVYSQTDGSVVTEESETSPARDTSRLLKEAEELTLAAGGCVARLAGIYGPERSFVLKSYLEGTATIEGNDGQGRILNQIHREDAAQALVHLLTNPVQGIFNVVDDHPMTQRECFEQLALLFNKPMPPVTAPNTSRKRAWTNKSISNAKLRSIGWAARYGSYLDALKSDPELAPSILAQVANRAEAVPGIER